MKKLNTLPLLLIILAVVIFFKPFLAQGNLPIPSDTIIGLYHPFRDFYAKDYPNGIPYKNFLITDPVRQQFPWRNISIESLKNGSLPLWNPYTMAGTPLLANFQSAALYPLNIFFFIFPFAISWSLLVFLQMLLAGIFLYWYLRFMKLSQPAAFLGGIAFAFCGFSTAWLEWNTLLHVALWLPLILLATEQLFRRMSYKWMSILVFAIVASFFAGHLQTFFYLILMYLVYVAARIIQIARQENKKDIFQNALKKYYPFFILSCIVVLITALQWIPSIQFINLSARGVDQINGWQQLGWFIPWEHLIQFVAPDFFGNPTTLNYWGVWNYGEFVGYVGIFPLIMAIYALYNRQDKKTLFFGLFFFLSIIFSFPTFFAKLPYMYDIPFLSTTQPTRLLFIADFSLAVLAALGLDFFLKSEKKWKIFYSLGIIAFIFLGIWAFAFFGSKVFPKMPVENLLVAKRNLYIPTFFFIITTMLLSVWVANTTIKRLDKMLNRRLLSLLLLIFLLCVTTFDLLRFSQKFTPFTDPQYLFPSTKTLSYLQNQSGQFRIMATDSRILPPNFSAMYHLQSLDGYDPLYIRRYGELITAIGRDKPDITPPFGFNRIITPQNFDSPFIDLLGVKYILSFNNLSSPKLEKVFTEGQTMIYKNNNAFPRTFFAQNIQIAGNKKEAISKLFKEKENLKNTAIVEDTGGLSSKVFNAGTAVIENYSANNISIKTKNKNEGFLVFMDTYYPTWHAKVCSTDIKQCRNVQIYITNYNFRGIVVPAGEHHIEFNNSLL
jgi:hypothetical protein